VRAAASSGLSRLIAEDTTTTSAPSRLWAAWPIATAMPRSRSRLTFWFRDVRARHRVAEIGQHLGNAAHPDAADADEVDRPMSRGSFMVLPLSSG